ncbi:hypothetical protein EG68_02269 [Paragonimus skrjabini miyazakii]|uniref:CID domain-containing protein n=1 Tax=Paragonimus skrjabini miyazakii TaxID=59628 RepID=A0A8S9Z3W9_9TREM|nr:hypothetical protein EG68_02269 [Paragonimus skrjabini miyazakii]
MDYSEDEAVKRLQQLDNSQSSVESTSQWFLAAKDMSKDAVKLWFKEFRKAPPKKKIAFLHLVNDIIQNGITIAPQYGKFFEPVLPTAFKETAKVHKHSVRAAVAHLLIVWACRRIYPKGFLRQLRYICQRAVAEADAPGASEDVKKNIISASPFAFSFSTVLLNAGASAKVTPSSTGEPTAHRKRHRFAKPVVSFAPEPMSSTGFAPIECGGDPTCNSISAFREELARELQTDAIQPPETSELVELLEKLQQPTASGDAATRRAIAQFPPEVSDANKAVEIITEASETERADFVNRIAECASRLNGYNELLEEEANQRLKLNLKLRAYHAQVKERIGQYEADLKDLNEKYAHGVALRQELSKHVSNLPDLQLLPDMTAGLDPLPTVGDLFG